ncbi:E3 ubiquitin-protein ligase E3D isoform X5 [Homo sapiens]|nr:E3 ubiquitin-protein ligase E3D isoform X5 [Homo sapiens]XP_054212695.1 E3 ubiquitin-protein ligase E3D isoform X5 [Homo sapiens]|eukprot:XP_011534544.1 E3 ubiquitin-protein ligase E3D isoform X8 [Homo sapiens]
MCCVSSDNHCKLEPKANTKVICKRCKVMLGETVSSETTKFYMTEIIIQSSERSFPIIPRSWFVQSVIAQCLVQLSSARSTFRFTIQGQDDKVYILLWLLNSDSLVIESLRNSKYIKKFPLLENTFKADSSSAWSAVKVLYQPCIKSRNEKLVSLWESDISVHPLTLPSATCLELLLILSKSNANLPSSLRRVNSFQESTFPLCCSFQFGVLLIEKLSRKLIWKLSRCLSHQHRMKGGLFEDVTIRAGHSPPPADSSQAGAHRGQQSAQEASITKTRTRAMG